MTTLNNHPHWSCGQYCWPHQSSNTDPSRTSIQFIIETILPIEVRNASHHSIWKAVEHWDRWLCFSGYCDAIHKVHMVSNANDCERAEWNIWVSLLLGISVAVMLFTVFYFRLTVIAAVFSSHHSAFEACEDRRVLKTFYIGMMVLLSIKVIINILLIYHSSRVSVKRFRNHLFRF